VIAPQVIEQVQSALGVIGYGADNFSIKNVSCPFHEDQHPSASLHKDKGLYCHACASWFTWKQLAGELGITWISRKSVAPLEWGRDVHGALPSETRNGLIAAGLSDMARALDLFFHYNYMLQERIEYVTLDLLSSCIEAVVNTYGIPFDFKPWTYRKVFEQLQGKRLPKKGEFLRSFFLSYFSLQLKEGKKLLKNSKRGRKEGRPSRETWLWIPRSRDDIAPLAAVLDRDWIVDAGALEIDDYQTARHYKAAATFQEVKARPGKYARRQIVASTKISFPTLKPYAELTGITITPQAPKRTELTPAQVLELPENHTALRLMIAQKKVKANAFMVDERGIRHELTKTGARQALAKGGGKLYRAEYQASDYRPEGTA